MDPRFFLLALRARYPVAIVVVILTVVAVMAATRLLPKRYTAEASVMVDIRTPDPVSSVLLSAPILPGSMSTQVEIIKSDLVSRRVAKLLKYDENVGLREEWLHATGGRIRIEDWIAKRLQRGLVVTPSRDSNIVLIGFNGGEPAAVTAVANAFAQAYVEVSIELKVDPARQYAKWFADQAKSLRDQVETAQARLSEFQRNKGIVATEENLDYEVAKLNDLSARLTAAQSEIRDARSKQRSSADVTDAMPEVLQNTVVAGLRANIAQLEARLKESAGNLGTSHPQYLRMQSELAELRNRLALESTHVASSYGATSTVGKSREVELRAAVESQKKKLLDMKRDRDEIAVLQRDVETAKRAYEAVTHRLNQASLESQATRTNISVLNPAIEPLEPSFPKPLNKMLALAVALGLLLAAGCVLALETIDRRIRAPEDLSEMLQVPVLAVVERGGRSRKPPLLAPVAALPAK
jgi:chain length determinant protein EpsF